MTRRLLEPGRLIGTVVEVTPGRVGADLPSARDAATSRYASRLARGEVGEFVAIEQEDAPVIGRVVRVSVLEKERSKVPERIGERPLVHPRGEVQILGSYDEERRTTRPAVGRYPRVGAKIYSLNGAMLRAVVGGQFSTWNQEIRRLALACIDGESPLDFPAEAIVGRHCAVLGATGGGKSWTTAKLVEELLENTKARVLLLDATGEYADLASSEAHAYVGQQVHDGRSVAPVRFTYRELLVHDLFCLFTPTAQAQAPKLREAIRSLKLLECVPHMAEGEVLVKENRPRAPFEAACKERARELGSPENAFDIHKLPEQIFHECVRYTPFRGPDGNYGPADDNARGHCAPLIARIESMLAARELEFLFPPDNGPSKSKERSLIREINDIASGERRFLRIDLSGLPSSFEVRPMLVNALGRKLLGFARDRWFSDRPLVVVLDEAHQFLGRRIGDDFVGQRLDQFELIAKEGRKYGLHLVLATQRPRDLTEQILSQMGTMIVHRLSNNGDREIVERASSEFNRSSSSFLPQLDQGEAILVGSDFSLPIPIKIEPPRAKPRLMSSGFGAEASQRRKSR